LTGLTSLQQFDVHANKLTGSIPTLTSLSSLGFFYVNNNALNGSIPTLSTLSNLQAITLGGNVLTGSVPAAPANLTAGQSSLCTNNLQTNSSPNDAAWNAATGLTHWYATPFANNKCDDVFNDQFEK
jgi:Leucine-rich repeat (LRR) protein